MMSTKWKASIYVLLGAASYGILSSIVKLGYAAGFSASEVTGSQVMFGAAMLWILCYTTGSFRKVTKSSILKLLAGGSFTGMTGVFYYYSLQMLDASIAVLLLFQFTWMGLLLDWLLQGKRPGRNQGWAVLLILGGTLLATGFSYESLAQLDTLGLILGLLSAASYTFFIYFSGRLETGLPALQRSAWMITGASIFVAVIYPPQFLWNGALQEGLWLWGLLLSVFGMVLPTFLYAKGAPKLDTGLSSVLGAIELPVVILCSALLLGESSGLLQWIGIATILLGIAVSEMKPSESRQSRKNR
ncbi:EamA family transporter [Paenibacillus sp. GD4]|uniref:EamA family transporter n=1 Tax=Paenibacillus sp. GD4 TaxID=3068890 RepID=UPI002796DCB2|nr:EamA family transporter [Paenibacillus sp. GD4]MDQ1912881.1 EamA family transporter [Paenibacillus sp. GD4]